MFWFFFFFNDTATTEIYTLSLHDALPILTAGGLSSGIDSALHVVELHYGAQVAQATADNMEHQGQGWKTNAGAGEPKQVLPTRPLAYRDHETIRQGTFLPEHPNPKPATPRRPHLARLDGHCAR